jgi:hypothetical protein
MGGERVGSADTFYEVETLSLRPKRRETKRHVRAEGNNVQKGTVTTRIVRRTEFRSICSR